VQVTAASLTGTFGTGPQKDAWGWISDGMVHIVASDAHNTRGRPLRLLPAYAAVREQLGEETARALFLDNPKAALEGHELPHVPDLPDPRTPPRRKRFFFF
jgi:protein-tyrosine phosphatase